MTVTALASVAALRELTGRRDLDDANVQAIRLLELVSSLVRMRCGQYLSPVDDDLAELTGNATSDLWLPQIPVRAVSAVEVRAGGELVYTALATTAYTWDRPGRLYRADGDWWGGPRGIVRLTYSHGYEVGHRVLDDAENLCVGIAARVLSNIGGARSESVGSYSVTYADVAAAGLTETEMEMIEHLSNPRTR